jgi:hypothetical protein
MDVNPERARYAVTPRGEPADYYVLQHAQQHGSLVVSNDRFFDYEDLRANTITVQFTLKGTEFTVYEEATWFRKPGSALRVLMTDLQKNVGSPEVSPDVPPDDVEPEDPSDSGDSM